MKGKTKLAAACALAAAAAIFGACRADDTSGGSGASQASSKTTTATTTTKASKPSPSAVAQAPAEDARRVTADELKKMLDAGKAVVYDTRPKAAYDAEHIKGSLSMPSGEVADRAGELPKDRTIVFYCT